MGFSVRVVAKGAWDLRLASTSRRGRLRRHAARTRGRGSAGAAPYRAGDARDEPVYHDTSFQLRDRSGRVAEDRKIAFLLTLNERALASS